jgi:hypothetical protein
MWCASPVAGRWSSRFTRGRDMAKGTVRNILALIGLGGGSSGSCPEPGVRTPA